MSVLPVISASRAKLGAAGSCESQAAGTPEAAWQRSSRCDINGSCVEVARHASGGVLIRDGKTGGASPVLAFGPGEWRAFLAAVAAGQLTVG